MPLFGRKKDDVTPAASHAAADEAAPSGASGVTPAPAITRRSVAEQRSFLLARVAPLRPFGVQIWDVGGLTLCEDITSDLDLPLVTTARISGWGVRASDLVGATYENPRALYVVDAIRATDNPGAPLVAGAAIEVEEGAILPEGMDAIVPAAEGRVSAEGYVLIGSEARLYQNLQRAGSELADGTPLLAAGEVLTPRAVAVLAEVGLDKVLVRPRPRVVVFSVGETLVEPGQPLTDPHQRYDAATALVTAAARSDGATVYPLGVVAPRASTIRQTISDQQMRADLIVVAGGGDLVRKVVAELGELDEAVVAINRESRYGFAAVGEDRTPLVILPTGPVSAYVGYQAFLRPIINTLNEVDPLAATRVEGVVLVELTATEGVTEYVPAIRNDDGTVLPVSSVDSELAWDLVRANVLLVIPDGWGGVAPGSRVECLVLDDLRVPESN